LSAVDADVSLAKFDLQVTVSEQFDEQGSSVGMGVALTYATDLFDEATMIGFAERFQQVLVAGSNDPDTSVGDIDIVTAQERESVLALGRGREVSLVDGVVPDLLTAQAERTPEAAAVSVEGDELTYAEFADRVGRLARYLISTGVGPEVRVAVAMD
ncbi:AMP-binding protein, partial [Rhodococcus rhodochrous]